MKNEYNSPEETNENKAEEPALGYRSKPSVVPPCQYTADELRERVLMATKHVEEGNYYTDDEIDDLILS